MSKRGTTQATHSELSVREVSERIYTLRGCQVMLDSDLAEIYEVENRTLKQAVRRNIERLPEDFMFEPTREEMENLRSQIVISSSENRVKADARPNLRSQFVISSSLDLSGAHGGGRYLPFVFTEPGVAMLSGILQSERAIKVNIAIMRAFIQLRKGQSANQVDLLAKMEALERSVGELKQQIGKSEKSEVLNPAPSKVGLPQEDKIRVIQKAVARHWGITVDDLKSAVRTRSVSTARHIAIFLIRKHLSIAFNEIGHHFGHRDHTTILHAYRKIHADSDHNGMVRGSLASLQKEIQPMLYL